MAVASTPRLDGGGGLADHAPAMHRSNTPQPSLLMQVVERSPAYVAAQDRDAWLALFSRDGVVEDPVGAAPNHRDALAGFFNTFIAGNEIRFEVIEDLTAGHEVVRDVVIHTRLSTGLTIEVPALLLYELVDEDGALRIRRLRAVWDLRRRSIGALAAGLRGLWTLCAVSLQMLRMQGLSGVLGYSRGLVSGIFGDGAATLERLSAAIRAGDPAAAEALFAADATVEFPVGTPAFRPHMARATRPWHRAADHTRDLRGVAHRVSFFGRGRGARGRRWRRLPRVRPKDPQARHGALLRASCLSGQVGCICASPQQFGPVPAVGTLFCRRRSRAKRRRFGGPGRTTRERGRKRHLEREGRALTDDAGDDDRSSEGLDQLARDRQAQA